MCPASASQHLPTLLSFRPRTLLLCLGPSPHHSSSVKVHLARDGRLIRRPSGADSQYNLSTQSGATAWSTVDSLVPNLELSADLHWPDHPHTFQDHKQKTQGHHGFLGFHSRDRRLPVRFPRLRAPPIGGVHFVSWKFSPPWPRALPVDTLHSRTVLFVLSTARAGHYRPPTAVPGGASYCPSSAVATPLIPTSS